MIQALERPATTASATKSCSLIAQRLAAHLPGEARPEQERDDQDDVAEARLGHGDQHHRDEDGGQRQPDVGQTA